MGKPTLLDTFCKAGGAGMGYHLAGFEVIGVDIEPQPHYPFEFVQADALEFIAQHGHKFDVIHASPPCQFGSEATPMAARANHENLIPVTREVLKQAGRPYVIENVEAVRRWLVNPLMICGSMLSLPVWRHRYFEIWPYFFMSPASCNHSRKPITVHSGSHTRRTWIPVLCTGGGDGVRASRKTHRPRESVEVVRWAMEIDWMTQNELSNAIPPRYTKWLGERLIAELSLRRSNKHLHRTAQAGFLLE
jgi:DNA (cytosine-5)-methyltransferase 1